MLHNDGRVALNSMVQALRRGPMTIDGDGSQTRSLCCVDDMIEGLIRLMNTPDDLAVSTGLPRLTAPAGLTAYLDYLRIRNRLYGTI